MGSCLSQKKINIPRRRAKEKLTESSIMAH
jgi:hypothetical protein